VKEVAGKKKLTFEEAMGKLEESAESLKKDGVTLEDALKNFEAGMEYYNQCTEILSEAKQRIEVFTKGGEE
jgi:exodeoxyribonuclease VII small subunit